VTQNDDLFAPVAFSNQTITVNEGDALNLQLHPTGNTGFVTSIGGIPAWTLVNGYLQGTAPEVTGDTSTNPSDTTTVTVYRTNSYGTSQGTLTIIINNTTAPIVTPITGVTHIGGTPLIESDTMDDGSFIEIDESVGVGERFVINKEWLDYFVLPKITSGTGTKSVWVGFPSEPNNSNYSTITNNDFIIAYEFSCSDSDRAANNWRLKTHIQGSQQVSVGIGSLTNGLYDYVLINDNTTLSFGALVDSQGHNPSTTVYNYATLPWYWSLQATTTAGNKNIVIATKGTDLDLDLQYFAEYTEPTAPTNLTSWNKALDFSGSNQYAMQVSNWSSVNALSMGFSGTTVGANSTDTSKTSDQNYSRPWAVATVFKADLNNSNQHIWNYGEGASSGQDNIALRLSASGNLYLHWGRSGSENELQITTGISSSRWYGVYIAHKGTRLSASNATAANLADCFDVRIMSDLDAFSSVGFNQSGPSKWLNTGDRMDRSIGGHLTIGGRGSNRSFHGKVASMVVTTLKKNQTMPTDNEIKKMITDPVKWVQNFKVGNDFRRPSYSSNTSNFAKNTGSANESTQVWLMGDGSNDSYSNMIRNYVQPSDQNYTKLQLNSMVSNDIETVNINGLT